MAFGGYGHDVPARVETGGCAEASRYRLLAKIQLTAPGRCRHLGYLRNFLAEGDCTAGVVSIVIPGYRSQYQEGACVINAR